MNSDKPIGHHLILELMECPSGLLSDSHHISQVMEQAVAASGAVMVKSFFHIFSPYGVSGVIIISESHFTIHTWPEHGYAAVDIFTCGDCIDMRVAVDTLSQGLKAGKQHEKLMKRGVVREGASAPCSCRNPA